MKGAPAKPIKRSGRVQGRPDRADGLGRRSRAGSGSSSGRTRSTSAAVADRVVDDRTFTLGEFEVESQRLQDQQDVGEEDRRVDSQDLGGGDRDLGGQLGRLQSSRNGTLARMARYSAMYRPACRISQTGVTSAGSRRQALRNGLSTRRSGRAVGPCCSGVLGMDLRQWVSRERPVVSRAFYPLVRSREPIAPTNPGALIWPGRSSTPRIQRGILSGEDGQSCRDRTSVSS